MKEVDLEFAIAKQRGDRSRGKSRRGVSLGKGTRPVRLGEKDRERRKRTNAVRSRKQSQPAHARKIDLVDYARSGVVASSGVSESQNSRMRRRRSVARVPATTSQAKQPMSSDADEKRSGRQERRGGSLVCRGGKKRRQRRWDLDRKGEPKGGYVRMQLGSDGRVAVTHKRGSHSIERKGVDNEALRRVKPEQVERERQSEQSDAKAIHADVYLADMLSRQEGSFARDASRGANKRKGVVSVKNLQKLQSLLSGSATGKKAWAEELGREVCAVGRVEQSGQNREVQWRQFPSVESAPEQTGSRTGMRPVLDLRRTKTGLPVLRGGRSGERRLLCQTSRGTSLCIENARQRALSMRRLTSRGGSESVGTPKVASQANGMSERSQSDVRNKQRAKGKVGALVQNRKTKRRSGSARVGGRLANVLLAKQRKAATDEKPSL